MVYFFDGMQMKKRIRRCASGKCLPDRRPPHQPVPMRPKDLLRALARVVHDHEVPVDDAEVAGTFEDGLVREDAIANERHEASYQRQDVLLDFVGVRERSGVGLEVHEAQREVGLREDRVPEGPAEPCLA